MIAGQPTKLVKWIEGVSRGRPFAVRVEIEAVIPDADPSEPCLGPAQLRLLDQLRDWADAGDLDSLARHGQVYERRSA